MCAFFNQPAFFLSICILLPFTFYLSPLAHYSLVSDPCSHTPLMQFVVLYEPCCVAWLLFVLVPWLGKALLVFLPACQKSEVCWNPGTLSTGNNSVSPTNGSLGPLHLTQLVSPLFSTSGHFPCMRNHLSSMVSHILISLSPTTRQWRLSWAQGPWSLICVWRKTEMSVTSWNCPSKFLGC